MMEEVARGQPNGLAAVDNGADDVGGHEGIADGLAHAGLWDGVFGGNLLIGFARRGRWRYCAGGCGQPILGSCRCLRCLLLVMCTYPIAKKALTLHLARREGRERSFGCNLMQRKVLASSHQQQTAQAPHRTGWSMPSLHSVVPSKCSNTSPAIPTASRSPTTGSCLWKTERSPFVGKTTPMVIANAR